MVVEEKKQEVLDSYKVVSNFRVNSKEEETIIQSEIHSYEQTIETYTSKV